jgi:MarR family transcriptional regulator, organic hydroperoxide resistance regulator
VDIKGQQPSMNVNPLRHKGIIGSRREKVKQSPCLATMLALAGGSGSPECLAFVQVLPAILSPAVACGILLLPLKGSSIGAAMTVKAETATPVARDIWELLVELSMSRVRQRFLATVTELGLSFPQAHALKVLRPGHPVPMRELADGLHCDPSNITGIVDRLGDRGLVERGSAPGDRRVKTLMLTEEGAALRMRLLDRLSEPPPGLGRLRLDEQRRLHDLLRRALLD